MQRRKLVKRTVETLKPPATGYAIHRDSELKGFGLRISSGGIRTWIFERRITGRVRRLALGQFPDMPAEKARKAAEKLAGQLADGVDIYAETQRTRAEAFRMPTVKAFALEEYIERHSKPHKRSWGEDDRLLRREVLPKIGKLKLDQVHRRDIIALLDPIEERGAPIVRNRTLAVVRKLFAFAIERGAIETSPVQHIKALPEHSRERTLTDDEINTLWKATAPEASGTRPMVKYALRLLLLTGQRAGEVAGLRTAELDLDGTLWTLPPERTKNRLAHTVPLSEPALTILREALGDDEREHVFTLVKGKSVTVWALARALSRVFADQPDRPTPHDLRRTVGTRLGSLGFNRLVMDKVLNHKDAGIGGVYDRHTYDPEKRKALDAWARELDRITTGKKPSTTNVVPLAR